MNPEIFRLVFHKNSYNTDFKRKAELFNSFFAKQCSLIDNNSKIPLTIFLKTNKSFLLNVTFTEHDIEKILLNLKPNKEHRHDSISIRMLQICKHPYVNILKSPINFVSKKDVSPLSGKKQML